MENLINRISIKSRMILVFIIVIILFILFGMFSVGEMRKLGALTQTIYQHPLQVSNAALAARLGVVRMHRTIKDLVLAETSLEVQDEIRQLHTDETYVYRQLDIIKTDILGDEGKVLEQEARKAFMNWKPFRNQVTELKLKGENQAAARLTRRLNAEYVQQLEDKMLDLTNYALNKAAGFADNAERIKQDIVMITIGSIVLVAIISLLIAYFVSSSILTSISALIRKMSEIVETGVFNPLVISGNNELSKMTLHFNRLIDKLREQIWIKDGQNELNRNLSGERTFEDLVTQSIRTVSRYVDACSGALYSFDATNSVCELRSSYAFVERKYLANRFHSGEGIVGQVALEKNPILLSNIGGDEAIGQSGTVSEPPKTIYCLPLLYEKRLYGVLEIASFATIDRVKKEFLDSASIIIAINLYTAIQNQKIRELLQHTEEANQLLQSQQEEMQALNEELQQQSEELQQQNRILDSQRRQVEEASRMKSEFLSNMSHELRTPLNSINALSKVLILQAGGRLSSEEINYLEIIQRNGKHLLNLINDILDLSKIEAGKLDISPGIFSVSQLLSTIVENLNPIAKEKGIELSTQLPVDFPRICNDESRVHKIVQNVVGNAIKFTEKGKVTVSASHDSKWIYIKVEDTGIGIAPNDLPFIFEEFRQADGTAARKFEGTGLGLAIAYKAAKKLGGDIKVESVPDRGSIFTIILPLQAATGDLMKDPNKSLLTSQLAASSEQSELKTVLVVDDDPHIISLISDSLIANGYRTLTATSGSEALNLAEIFQPFAITLDVIIPDMDGWEVLQGLKSNPKTADIPVIIVSVSEDLETGFALGAIGYITKPVKSDELIAEIRKINYRNPYSIMIVDDNEVDRRTMARIIQEQGMKAISISNGKQCLQILEKMSPDVIILDLVMPEMDGFGVLESIRNNPRTQQLPVIVATAKDLTASEKMKLKSQVSSILIKSEVDAESLLKQIRNLLRHLKEKSPNQRSKPVLQKNLVLMVEDNESAVIQVKQILKTEGIEVAVAGSGNEALAFVKHTLPAGIILDLMMPGMDGFEVLEKIRGTEHTAELPVLVLTAKDLTLDDLKRLSSNHVQQLIQKGDIDKEGLILKTKQMLGWQSEPFIKSAQKEIQVTPRQAMRIHDQPSTILIIEDNLDNLTAIKAVLKGQYNLLDTHDGMTGLEIIRKETPDLILLDISLPGTDGISLVKMIKAAESTSRIPVIALTARTMKGDKEAILAGGCDDYLSKPFDPEELLKKIKEWL